MVPLSRDIGSSSCGSVGGEKKRKSDAKLMATVGETLAFAFNCGANIKILFLVSLIAATLNGLVYPILAYLFSSSFSDIVAASNDLSKVRELSFKFLIVGAYAFVCGFIQSWSFELFTLTATKRFRLEWFKALLRQDPSFFDVHDIGGIAGQVEVSANKYRRGMGRKFGEGVQFLTTGIGGIGYAMYASWRVALLVLAVLPFVSVAALSVLQINQTKGSRAAASYKTASSVAYSAVSAIKTVFSLNCVQEIIDKYAEATQEAYKIATGVLIKQGLAYGSMFGSFLFLYLLLTLYGSSLLYREVRNEGCDPSDAVPNAVACDTTGSDVLGAMLGLAFAAQGASQVGNFAAAFVEARIAAYEALKAINRRSGDPEQTIYRTEEDDIGSTSHSRRPGDPEKNRIKAILPKYEIDSSSDAGLKPKKIDGAISFKNVSFVYPTRPLEPVLNNFTVDIVPGQTVAFVGPSGSGKSTVVGLLERFYDPQSGRVEIDGINLKDINVAHLRGMIGYVGQEPTLFATSILDNIKYGNPNATQEEIEEAARMANAHDFISTFPDGYNTQVGDKGSQLSGGQKQRIAICRCLIRSPKLLILDEATSALDSESELVVQEALDNILASKKITTVIIAHRLSTIRNVDRINVIVCGEVKEYGTHEELMAKNEGYYRNLVLKQDGQHANSSTPISTDCYSAVDLNNLVEEEEEKTKVEIPDTSDEDVHLQFKNVFFSYPTRPSKAVLHKFNLKIKKGQTVALCGPSGGGKSTTVGLIERFYDPVSGSVEYLGTDVRDLNVGWYREHIGFVGQEPTLFNDTIAHNITFGAKDVTRQDVIEAAKHANAYDFIMSFEQNFDTAVGERGAQLSGGQKQRVAIARALVRKPQILLLDEATSALDNESEAIVQAAIDKLMQSSDQTVIVIAHRLSTIRNADVIAFIADGRVLETGSHEELLKKPHGRYRRLFDSSQRNANINTTSIKNKDAKEQNDKVDDEIINWDEQVDEEELGRKLDTKRARELAFVDAFHILVGSIGAVMAGGIFPLWGVLFSEMINILFIPVLPCADMADVNRYGFDSCEDYWNDVADYMQRRSFDIAWFWAILLIGCLLGYVFLFFGFGTANERLNKRLRDASFSALMRQEAAYFDQRSIGRITSQLEDDAARIHAFSSEPVRSALIALAAVITGVVLSFIYMWQFALLAIGCIPIMGVAVSIEMKRILGEDQSSDEEESEGLNTPGGVVVETLLNIRTVSALTLENTRYKDYEKFIECSELKSKNQAFMSGLTAGSVLAVVQFVNALQLWFGGWLLYTFPDDYQLRDFLISIFSVIFALFGLGSAFQDISDRREVEKSALRVFYLLDRESAIDPLSSEGKKLMIF